MDIVDILQGSLSLIFVLISFIIGVTIISKYGKYKNRLYILVGLYWLMLSTLWLPEAVSFLMSLIIQQTLSIEWYFIIGNSFVPVAIICWVIAYTDMTNKKIQKLAVGLILIFSIIFEGLFFYYFFLDINLIGVINPLRPFSADLGYFLTILLFISFLILFVTGFKFARKSIKAENKEVRLKGKLLQFAFIAFTIAALLEKTARSILIGTVFADPTILLLSVMLVVVRLLLISSAIAFYGGFLLPRWMKEIFMQ
ncbi:MAG TPA: hypothetical protein VMV43_08780 [Candidatus Nanopelagicaceae bacterium]|nr:hypothetical protein [Candidatus Nanopelagicaceae bacterium]